MKKLLIISIIICYKASSVLGNVLQEYSAATPDTKFKLEGFFLSQSGFRDQDKLKEDEKNISKNRKDFGFYTETTLSATITKVVNDITYGAKIILMPTTKVKTSFNFNGSHIFIESDWGKVEVGSPHDAGTKMRIIGDNIVAGTGSTGNWSRYANIRSKNMRYFGLTGTEIKEGVAPEFVTYKEYFFDSLFKTQLNQIHDRTEPSRKISYFIPKIKGFQFGISYIPDSGNVGGSAHNESSLKSRSGITSIKIDSDNIWIINRNVKDAFSAGITYEHKFSDKIGLKLAATGEYGRAISKIKLIKNERKNNKQVLAEYKPSNLKTYNIGAILIYGKFSYAASYGTLGKSLTTKKYYKTGRDTCYYNGTISYTQDKIKTSISYFRSERFKNTIDVIALGTEYKLEPGLVPYCEIAYFKAKGKPSHYPNAPEKKTKGTIGVLGIKLKF